MKTRMILLMVTGIGLSGLLSGCSAIGFVAGTVIDNTFTEEKALGVPTARQLRDSTVKIQKGTRIIVEKSNGQKQEGIYAGTRVVTMQIDREEVPAALESGLVTLLSERSDNSGHLAYEEAARPSSLLMAGPKFAEANTPAAEARYESRSVTLSADALLLLADDGPVKIPVVYIKGINALQKKDTTMRFVIFGAITDFMLLQGALGVLLTSS